MDRMEARRRLGEGQDASPWVLFSSLQGVTNPIKRAPLAYAASRPCENTRPDVKLKLLTGVPHDQLPLWINASSHVLLTSDAGGVAEYHQGSIGLQRAVFSTDVRATSRRSPRRNRIALSPTPRRRLSPSPTSRNSRFSGPSNLRRHVAPMALDAIGRRLLEIYRRLCPSKTSKHAEFPS